ncbi:MAG: polysaccharide deacetylase family protein [Coriobacteriia bacterium]|nr:polysaccharide deacetylase family protein [Coriobacteriia bacterium]
MAVQEPPADPSWGLASAKTKFLLYHDLASLRAGDKAEARELFRRQLSLMAGWGFSFRSMSEFLAGNASGHKDVVITFDDGGSSFIDCALPVLAEFSAPATMYVVAGFVGCHGRVMEFLTWDQIEKLAAQGVDIGSHTLSHLLLGDMSADAVRFEIDSAAELFRAHGISPTTLAYPYGRRSDAAKQIVRESGFQAAFMIKKGGRDAFELRRRLFTLTESEPLVRFFLADNYFPVRKAIVSVVPERFRREGKPIPPELLGANAFGIDAWQPPESLRGRWAVAHGTPG